MLVLYLCEGFTHYYISMFLKDFYVLKLHTLFVGNIEIMTLMCKFLYD